MLHPFNQPRSCGLAFVSVDCILQFGLDIFCALLNRVETIRPYCGIVIRGPAQVGPAQVGPAQLGPAQVGPA